MLSKPSRPHMRLRAAREPPTRCRATAAPAPLSLPCRECRRPAEISLTSRVELFLLEGSSGQPMTGVDQLLLRRVAAETEADRRPRLTVVKPECTQYVTGPAGAAGAGAAERKGDVAQVGDQSRRINAFAADIQIAVISVGRTAVHDPARAQCMDRGFPQLLHMIVVARTPLVGELRGRPESDAQRRRQCARAKPLLLAAAVD